MDTIQYKVCDAGGLCDTAFAFVEIIEQVARKPVANPDSVTTVDFVDVSFNILSNDESQGDNVLPVLIDSTRNGTIVFDELGNVLYSPSQYFIGFDSLRYEITKSYGTKDTTLSYIEVQLNNVAPVGLGGEYLLVTNSLNIELAKSNSR